MKSTYRVKLLGVVALQIVLLPFMRFENGNEFVLESWQDWSLFGVFLALIFTALNIKCERCKTSGWSLVLGKSTTRKTQMMLLTYPFKRRCSVCDTERY